MQELDEPRFDAPVLAFVVGVVARAGRLPRSARLSRNVEAAGSCGSCSTRTSAIRRAA